MTRPCVKIVFQSLAELREEFAANLKNGGTFISQKTALKERDECDVALIHPLTNAELIVQASVVWIAPDNSGAGVALIGFTPEKRAEIEAFIENPSQSAGPAILDSFVNGDDENQSPQQRLRNLPVAEQYKIARGNIPSERIALERIYGKSVWEPLLQNPRLTVPEVARIARMGSLPVPLVELIVNNPSWVSSPPVRRALLTNPRLSRDQIPRVLKTMPLSELRLVSKQMGYTSAVREAARRMMKT